MNGARRLFKMLEDFAGNIAFGFGDQWSSGDQGQAVPNLTTTTTTKSTTTSTTTTTRSSIALDSSYQELLDKYYSTSTTHKPKMTMLEKVKEQGALSTWNMNKQDKWKLLAQLSKSYLEKRLGRYRRAAFDAHGKAEKQVSLLLLVGDGAARHHSTLCACAVQSRVAL